MIQRDEPSVIAPPGTAPFTPESTADARLVGSAAGENVTTTVGTLVVLLMATAVFWRTAYPTITWWDSSGYSLAAATLGVYAPPGSLLLTLLGWPIARLVAGTSAAHALNLLAGVLAGLTVALVYLTATRASSIARPAGRMDSPRRVSRGTAVGAAVGTACGALTLAFSGTLWAYAVMFTPYVLSALFTAVILWTMLRWWHSADASHAWLWIGVLGLEFGLDFSVHRTNALLIPGAVAWVLLRRPGAFRSARSVGAAT
ncbi:MAG TPA: DUF2723 domain-containing protein, partial [Gemmatimonadaceae bacterium]|nr:DUF2723 domain-containing protein [Gemmatimonadaceae bacterium]